MYIPQHQHYRTKRNNWLLHGIHPSLFPILPIIASKKKKTTVDMATHTNYKTPHPVSGSQGRKRKTP